jgi:hypothetical protein
LVSEIQFLLTETRIDGVSVIPEVDPEWFHSLIGPPSRIVDPVGRRVGRTRNPQIHVWDREGIYVHEHHYTRKATTFSVLLAHKGEYVFSPRNAATAIVFIGSRQSTASDRLESALPASGLPFERHLGDHWSAKAGEFSLHVSGFAERTARGRKSSVRTLGDIQASWPHDPWQAPATRA